MSFCKIFYVLFTVLFLVSYFLGVSWIHPEETFSWARLAFLAAMFILLDKYQLVPGPLSCPKFYTIYKVVAALVIANVAMVTIWWQTEEFLKWSLLGLSSLLKYIPVLGKKLDFGESPRVVAIVHLLVAVYFLLWVIGSSNIISRLKGSSCPPMSRAATSCPSTPRVVRRRRSRSRC